MRDARSETDRNETGTSETERPRPDLAETLAVLEDALRNRPVAAEDRILAGDDRRSVDEGLAILRCYVSIADRHIRQAVLDVLVLAADPLADAQCDPCSWNPGGS